MERESNGRKYREILVRETRERKWCKKIARRIYRERKWGEKYSKIVEMDYRYILSESNL